MRQFLKKILRGKYISSRVILAIDVVVSTLASWIAVVSVGALMTHAVLPRLDIVYYTIVAFLVSPVFFWLSKTHRASIYDPTISRKSRKEK